MLAKEIMTKEVLTVSPQTSVQEVAKLLIEHKISGVPVVEEGKLVGIVSEGDLIIKDTNLHIPSVINVLGSIIYLESPKKLEEEIKKITAVEVKDLMTKEVFTVQEDSDISEVATLMAEKRINRVPVVKGEEIVGIISRGDIVKSIARID
jgi:CBS domain-containing protein